jgi:L-seryl-tRNA(Ser) seleniumtransferase
LGFKYKSNALEKLGVRSWINARNWTSTIGSTWIDERVLEAMNDVAKTFCDMYELLARADEKVAKLCNVEDAHVTIGAGAAIELAVAGCMAGNDYRKWDALPNTEGMRNEVVFPRAHYTDYAPQWTASGAKLVEYGQAGVLKSFKKELSSKITDKTCCLSYTVSYNITGRGEFHLEDVIEAGKKYDLPVIVDAASMLPPVANLHKYTDMGADISCFSGGKGLRAPASTGMMLGNGKGVDIIQAVRDYSYPHSGWGRGHKMSKEQIVGLVTALEIFIEEGDKQYEKQMELAEYFVRELSEIPGLNVSIIPNDDSSYEHPVVPHVPRVLIKWDAKEVGLNAKELDNAMAQEDPPIFLKERHYSDYTSSKVWRLIDTYFLRSGEEQIIVDRLKQTFMKK